jgi:hypothetical protein
MAPGGALGILLAFIKPFEKDQEGKLFDGVKRIAAGPELVLQGIDL